MKNIVVLTGAGISAESGISTFRDPNGLWEGHDVMDVATPEGWKKDKEMVLEFYNQRRVQAWDAQPNYGHHGLVELEKDYKVQIITQNVDDLHEKAGSSFILHLHGELKKSRSTLDPSLIYEQKTPYLKLGDTCKKGSQLRPHIVWFGEAVPMIEPAIDFCKQADIIVIIGTSMVVYPAAGLFDYASENCTIYLINPENIDIPVTSKKVIKIQKTAVEGMKELLKTLKKTNS